MMLEMKYFILKPRSRTKGDPHAFASRAALFTYADVIEMEDESLATSLRLWAGKEESRNRALTADDDDGLTAITRTLFDLYNQGGPGAEQLIRARNDIIDVIVKRIKG